jgi:hypothetical protein
VRRSGGRGGRERDGGHDRRRHDVAIGADTGSRWRLTRTRAVSFLLVDAVRRHGRRTEPRRLDVARIIRVVGTGG